MSIKTKTFKTKVVQYVFDHTSPKMSELQKKAAFLETAKHFGIQRPECIEHWVENQLNYDTPDLRFSNSRKKVAKEVFAKIRKSNFKFYPIKNYTTKEKLNLIFERYFSYTGSTVSFLNLHHLNRDQWYSWISEIMLTAKLDDKIIFSYEEVQKVKNYKHTIFQYALGITRTHKDLHRPLCKSYKQSHKTLAKLRKNEERTIIRLVNTLFINLLDGRCVLAKSYNKKYSMK